MFTERTQSIIDLAKDLACATGASDLTVAAVVAAICRRREPAGLLARVTGLSLAELHARSPEFPDPVACSGRMVVSDDLRELLAGAKDLAAEVQDAGHPGAIDPRHLACAVAVAPAGCALLKTTPLTRTRAIELLASWYQNDIPIPRLEELAASLAAMRSVLLGKVFGQDHAVLAFVEGLYNAEVLAASDTDRRAPRAVFVFAGPPGVGKTLLAETGAVHLGRPFKRFDMSSYSNNLLADALAGDPPMYKGARPGVLTEFVEKNPNAVLLFDEIEKTHAVAIQLFLQVLDAGVLEDRYHERNVIFKDTTIIFTTNAGRKLYDRPNETGVLTANDSFHRQTIMDALQTELHPHTREPFFPPALCSRMATGYPVLFNHLRVNELERVVNAELCRVGGLFEKQYDKTITFDELLGLCLVLREGTRADARVLRAQAETFVKTEIFAVCELFETERLEEALQRVTRIHFGVDEKARTSDPEIAHLFDSTDSPRILLIADGALGTLYRDHLPGFAWHLASTAEDALEILATTEVQAVLLDIWLGRPELPGGDGWGAFDHVPPASSSLDQGQELLRKVRARLPETPVFLLSLPATGPDQKEAHSIEDELFMACVRGGGARGLIRSRFAVTQAEGWAVRRDELAAELTDLCRGLHREAEAERLGRERKVLAFDAMPRADLSMREISIRLRHLHLARAMASTDVGEVLADVERPATSFSDVIGAKAAKEELRFFVEYLRGPRRYAALGLKPPKGVLLHGPPGTGKTMLARAMAGESNVAFIPAVASNFVTIWQGSGPQSIRDLFARARRYAPAIIFIDELDSIGRVRAGALGEGRSQENTLNALLAEMDGFSSPSSSRPIFLLAATNFPLESRSRGLDLRTLDPALVRRFTRTILVDLPDRSARAEYLEKRLRDRPGARIGPDAIRQLAGRSQGLSIANLELVIESAARRAARERTELTDGLLTEAFEVSRFGEANTRDREAVTRTARHEAGHVVMYWLAGRYPAYVTVVSRQDHGGYTLASAEDTEEQGVMTRQQLLAQIRILLGGRAAELAFYGPEAGLTTGPSADLESASDVARTMICQFGMDEEGRIVATPALLRAEAALGSGLYQRVTEAAQRILQREMEATSRAIAAHRDHLETVAVTLLERERLTADELKALLPESAPE